MGVLIYLDDDGDEMETRSHLLCNSCSFLLLISCHDRCPQMTGDSR